MQIHQIREKFAKRKRRVGRGGKKGTYSGRGMKGQKSRSGAHINPIFEGGRSTLIEHLPKKRGFKSIFSKNQIVSLEKIEKHFKVGDEVSPLSLHQKGLVSKMKMPVKILGSHEIAKKISVRGCLVSKSARDKIEKAGGEVL